MTHPTIETHVLMRSVLDAAGAKRVSQATGFALGTVYSWARDPREESIDGSGSANPFDRVEQIVGLLATRGQEGRAAVVEMRTWFDGLFERTIGAAPAALTPERMHQHITTLTSEFADVLQQSTKTDRAQLRKELSELVAASEHVMHELAASELRAS